MNRRHVFAAVVGALLLGGLLGASQPVATAVDHPEQAVEQAVEQAAWPAQPEPALSPDTVDAEPLTRCSTNSDCPHSQCREGQCGGCSTNSDCSYGRCRSQRCGECSTNSDCDGWGTCRESQCGRCSTNSDCGAWGACRDGRCERSPY